MWVFLNKVFYREGLLAPRPTPKLEDHPSSAVCECLFNIFAATLLIGGRSSIRNLSTRHAMVTGTHYIKAKLSNKSIIWIFFNNLFVFLCNQSRNIISFYFLIILFFTWKRSKGYLLVHVATTVFLIYNRSQGNFLALKFSFNKQRMHKILPLCLWVPRLKFWNTRLFCKTKTYSGMCPSAVGFRFLLSLPKRRRTFEVVMTLSLLSVRFRIDILKYIYDKNTFLLYSWSFWNLNSLVTVKVLLGSNLMAT